jgi:hypothetical protein
MRVYIKAKLSYSRSSKDTSSEMSGLARSVSPWYRRLVSLVEI